MIAPWVSNRSAGVTVIDSYVEMKIGESIAARADDGTDRAVSLVAVDERSAIVRVDDSVAQIPLGHFRNRTLGNPPDDVVSVVDLDGVRIGADVTRPFVVGSRYSLSLLNLSGDARLFVGPARRMLTPSGRHVFPVPDYAWNFGENWLTKVPYGWHLGVDVDSDRGHPLVAIADGVIVAVRYFDADTEPEDYWGNGLALHGDDGFLYVYMHWDSLSEGIGEGCRVRAGDEIAAMGRSGFDSMGRIATHLHLEMMVLQQPERFRFTFEIEQDVLPTPNRFLPEKLRGFVVNPYPYMVEWYGGT